MSKSHVFVYNPAEKTKEQLVAEFVIRQESYNELMKDIKGSSKTTPPQHFLIAGQRGMGKTTMLLRIKYAVEDDTALNKFLIPIRFNEEQNNIGGLEQLWEETALLLETKKQEYEGLYDEMQKYESEKDYVSISFKLLENRLKANKQRALLMLDNIGKLFDKFTDLERAHLRTILITSPHIQILGGSSQILEHTFNYDQPFFEFFRQIKLQPLDEKSTHSLLRALAKEYGGVQRIEELIKNSPGRIDALRKLTGGVPRTMVLLFEIFVDEADGSAFDDLQALLENVTTLYMHRVDDLKDQQQLILDALARAYKAITAAEVLKLTKLHRKGVKTNQISAQLKQLEDNQVVESIELEGRTKAYAIRERFFNIWYLMRNGRKHNKEEVKWLVHFFEVWYDVHEFKDLARRQIECMRSGKYSTRAAYYKTQALHGLITDEKIKRELLDEAHKYLLSKNNREWAEVIKRQSPDNQLSFIQEAQRSFGLGDKEKALDNLLKAVSQKEADSEIILASFYQEVMKNKAEASKWYSKSIEPTTSTGMNLIAGWYANNAKEDLAEFYYKLAIENGNLHAIFNLAYFYHHLKEDFEKAEQYYKKAVEHGYVKAMSNLGLLYNKQEKYEMAEKYYLMAADRGDIKAIGNLGVLHETVKKDYVKAKYYYEKAASFGNLTAMVNIGILYQFVLKDYLKAEEWYLKAAEWGDKKALGNLGVLYHLHLNNLSKAEEYYLKAVEAGSVRSSFNLALFYQNIKMDFDKAETYYLTAIDGGDAQAILNLALLYTQEKPNYELAEKYYLMAIEKGDDNALFNLASFYENEMLNFEKAEKYYLMGAVKGDMKSLSNLAVFYELQIKDSQKAIEFYLKAIEKGSATSAFNLALLYDLTFKDYALAKEYYLKAIELGSVEAMSNLGLLYERFEKDFANAEKYYLLASEKGSVNALINLGMLYSLEKKEYHKAEKYFLQALDKGDKDAPYFLAGLYSDHLDQYEKAEKYYLLAVQGGDVDAVLELGELYEEKLKEYDKAEYYYLEAWKKGKADEAASSLILLHDTAKRDFPKTIQFVEDLLAENPNDIWANYLLTCLALDKSNFVNAFKHGEVYLNQKTAYEDLESVIDVLTYFMEKKQYHFLLSQFKQENGLLMLHAKPYYYALAYFLRKELPGEYEKTPAELKETVQEIIKAAKGG